MSRKTAVEMHPKKDEIERRLAQGDTILSISQQYGISRPALSKHKANRLPDKVVKAVQNRDITDAQELLNIILKAVRHMETMADSCDDYLLDPDNPDRYYMGPRAHEVDVIWEEPVETPSGDYKYLRRRNTLQELLDKLSMSGDIISMKSQHTDPRILLIRSAEALTKQMDMLVQAWKSADQGRSAFIDTPAWAQVVKIVLDATEPYPEVRRVIADELSKVSE
jgi:hypothetical protein